VKVLVETPARLSSQQKKLMREFQEQSSADNYPLRQEFEKKTQVFFQRKDALGK
jgi:DnaJ-class molecular chaperone